MWCFLHRNFPVMYVSFPKKSLIPQLDGSNSSPKSKLIFHGSNKFTTESNLAPSSSSYSMFGYCSSDNCKLYPNRKRAKVGNFYACFVSTDSSIKACNLVHTHSRTNLCLTLSLQGYSKTRIRWGRGGQLDPPLPLNPMFDVQI